MNYQLLRDIIKLLEEFESNPSSSKYTNDVKGFSSWVAESVDKKYEMGTEPAWDSKEKGRSPESVIATLLVHLNRYARTYSKAAIAGSAFSTQDEFIYLINLKARGPMTKTELIKMNVHDKPVGIQIINRLISQGWIKQDDSKTDRRSKVISITDQGVKALENQMQKIRVATMIVSGDLSNNEKMDLIRLLSKLDKFHNPIFSRNIDSDLLLEIVMKDYMPGLN